MPGQGDELRTEQQVAELRAKDFWLYQWMDSYLVKSTQRAAALLQKAQPLEALRQIVYEAAQEKTSPTGIIPTDENIIVAGGNLDLSNDMTCPHWECRKNQVDGLFSHVWHYFDRIVVVGVSARDLNDEWDRYSRESLIEHLLGHIRVLLYLRNIGADDLLVFAEKPEKCTQHWRKHAQEVGLRNALPEAKQLVEVLAREADIEPRLCETRTHTHYTLRHPSLLRAFDTMGPNGRASSLTGRQKVAEQVVALLSAQLVSDIQAARQLSASLGSDFFLHKDMLRSAKRKPTEADVAFQFSLPILEGIEPELLLRIRHDEHEHFEAFRTKLRLAIKARLERSDASDTADVALEIRRDVIDPALNEIERRLKAARELMQRKARLNLGLGSLVTTCGVLTANPAITGVGVAAMIGTSVTAGNKYLEEKRDIALSDMYFLWQAKQHAIDGW